VCNFSQLFVIPAKIRIPFISSQLPGRKNSIAETQQMAIFINPEKIFDLLKVAYFPLKILFPPHCPVCFLCLKSKTSQHIGKKTNQEDIRGKGRYNNK
jgi:hypothetical protein